MPSRFGAISGTVLASSHPWLPASSSQSNWATSPSSVSSNSIISLWYSQRILCSSPPSSSAGYPNHVSERAEDIVVRTVGQRDLRALACLWRSMRLEEAGSRDPETGADLSPFYALADRRSREPATILLIAYRGEGAVGFYCGRVQGRVGRGVDLYVRAEARRRGVGRRLVEVALAEYRARGADHIVGALRGDEGSHGFWASVWREHPSRLLAMRSAAGVEWRTRSLTAPTDSPPASRTRSSRPPSPP